MSELQLSSSTRALLEAAKGDGPSAGTRAKIWNGVASTASVGAAAATSSIAAGSTATASASKLLAMGALLGSVVSVGVTLVVLRVAGPLAPRAVVAPPPPAAQAISAVVPDVAPSPVHGVAVPVARPSSLAEPALPGPAPLAAAVAPLGQAPSAPATDAVARSGPAGVPGMMNAPPTAVAATRSAPKAVVRHVPAPIEAADEDPLMHEAALVAEARGSLVRGDPLGALRMAQAAGKLSSRGLEPEELSLQARALRALGRDTEADGVEADLRSRYPDHALSR